MWRFKFLEAMMFDTDSGGAPGGTGSAPETSPAGSSAGDTGQAGGSTPNPFDQLVQLMNEPATPVQSGEQPRTPATEQVLHSGFVPQPGQEPGQRPLQRVDLSKPTPVASSPGQQQPGPAAPPDPRDVALQQMREELAQLRGTIQAQQPRAPEPPQQQQPQRRYNFSAPAQVMEALRSEDANVASQTFFGLLSEMAERVHTAVMQDVQQVAPHIVKAATQQAGQVSQQQRVETDFYGTHKDLDQEHLRPIVTSVAARYIQELGPNFKSYTPEFRDEVARRARAVLYATTGVTQNFRPGPDQVAGRNGPAQLSPQGTRPNSGVQPNGAGLDHNSPQAIASALFG